MSCIFLSFNCLDYLILLSCIFSLNIICPSGTIFQHYFLCLQIKVFYYHPGPSENIGILTTNKSGKNIYFLYQNQGKHIF